MLVGLLDFRGIIPVRGLRLRLSVLCVCDLLCFWLQWYWGCRLMKSRMPLAADCSAAISAFFHPSDSEKNVEL